MPSSTTIHTVFKQTFDAYTPISDTTWQAMLAITRIQKLSKHQILYPAGEPPRSFAWIFKGLVRGFICDEQGKE